MIQLVEDCRKCQTIVTERSEVSRAVLEEVTVKEYEGCFGVMQMFHIVIMMVLM